MLPFILSYETWVELRADEPSWGVVTYQMHLPDSVLRDPQRLSVWVGGHEVPFGVSKVWMYRYPSGFVRSLRLYLPASLEASETIRYVIRVGEPGASQKWPGFKRTKDGFEVNTGSRVFRVRHVKLGRLPKGAWNYLSVETTVDGETHVFVPLAAPRNGDTLFSYGPPRVEVDETPACLVMRLFYDSALAVVPGGKPQPAPWLSAFVVLTFPREDSAFSVFVRRTVSKTRRLSSGHLLGFLGLRGSSPKVAVRRDIPYGQEDPFEVYAPERLGDEPASEKVFDYFAADSVSYARFTTLNARTLWDAYAVKGEKAVSLVGANSNKFQSGWAVGHARLALGPDTGWAWVLDTPVINLSSHAYEPWAHATVGLGWRWNPNAQELLREAKRLITSSKVFYPPRDTASESVPAESPWPGWRVYRASSNPELILRNPGPDSALGVAFFGLVGGPAEAVVVARGDTIGGSLGRSGDTTWILASTWLAPAESLVAQILPGSGKPAFKVERLKPDKETGLVAEFKVGRWEIGHIKKIYEAKGDTYRVVNGLFVRTQTPSGWVAGVPLARPYGCVFHPQDAFSHLDEEHRIVHYGPPAEFWTGVSAGGAVLRFTYKGGQELVGADDEHFHSQRQDYLTGAAEVIIPKGGSMALVRVHRYLRRGIYNHNGFPLSVVLYETKDAKVKYDTTLAPWTYQIDSINNRRVVLGLKDLPILDNTGVAKTLESRPDGFYLWSSANWRGNSPFYLLGKYGEFEGWYAFDSGRDHQCDATLVLVPGWRRLASRETYFDAFGYTCASGQLYVGDAGAVGIADIAQTGWGMGWLPSWVAPGNYDDWFAIIPGMLFKPEALRRRAKAQLGVNFQVR